MRTLSNSLRMLTRAVLVLIPIVSPAETNNGAVMSAERFVPMTGQASLLDLAIALGHTPVCRNVAF